MIGDLRLCDSRCSTGLRESVPVPRLRGRQGHGGLENTPLRTSLTMEVAAPDHKWFH